MRTLGSVVVLVAVAGMLIGCGEGSTPQSTFEKMKVAGKANDLAGTIKYMTPESQNVMVGGMAFGAAMGAKMAKTLGKADPDLEALLKKHGIDLEKLPKATGAADANKAVKDLGAQVKDKPGFIADMEKLNEKKGKKKPDMAAQMGDATLKDVKITGDSAEGKVVIKKDGKETTRPIHFKLIGGQWLIDIIPEMGKK